jgi:pyruvate-ferredoxin/flavodoxin oxidoreductase
VNLLVLDTQVYSNTGGQKSKATPIGAIAKFAASGKGIASKKLSTQMVNYKYAYVAQICYGSAPAQALKAIAEAESFNGPSLILAYAPCIEHGIDMGKTAQQMKMAVDSGFWPLFRYDPRKLGTAEGPLKIDSKEPSMDVAEFMTSENRFRSLKKTSPERFAELIKLAKDDVALQWKYLKMIEANLKN